MFSAKLREDVLNERLRSIDAKKRKLEEKIAQVEALQKKVDSFPTSTRLPETPIYRVGEYSLFKNPIKRPCSSCRVVRNHTQVPINASTYIFECPACHIKEAINFS